MTHNAVDAYAGFAARIVALVGKAMGWIMVPVVCLVFSVAVLRYGFGIGYAWLSELYTWLNGTAVMLAAAYTWQEDRQVRVSIFYDRWSVRARAVVDIVGILAILLPTVAVIAYWSWTPIVFSWRRLEGSRALDGLPGVFLLKSVVLVFCALMAIQAFVYLRANLRALRSPPSRP